MFRKAILAIGACIALTALPAAAQDDAADEAALAAVMGMFKAEPLTAAEESRLPMATEVVAKMIPPGSLGEMMGSLFDGFLKPIMGMDLEPSAANVAEQLGVAAYDITIEEGDSAEALAILDPVWTKRKQIERDMIPALMTQMMTAIEPPMRNAMSEVYAVHFTAEELNDINAFFGTTSGANFARKSFTISSDPRLIGSMMESMPLIMSTIADIEQQIEGATADLPPVRGFDELDPAERARLSELVGVSEAELKALMADAEDVAVEAVEAAAVEEEATPGGLEEDTAQ